MGSRFSPLNLRSRVRLNKTSRGLLNLYSGTVLSGFGWGMVLPITLVIALAFGVSEGVVAQLVTAFAVGKTAGIPVAGILADRFGTRSSLLGGPALIAIGMLAAAASPWFLLLPVAMFIAGTGDSLWALGREISGVDLVRRDQRGRVLSGFHGLHAAGMAIGPIVGGFLADAVNFRAVFLEYAAVGGAAFVLALVAHNAKASHRPQASPTNAGGGAKGIRGRIAATGALLKELEPHMRTTYLVLVFATVAAFMFRMTFQSMLPIFAGSELGFTPLQIGALFSISGALVIAMIVPVGFILDKIGRKWATVPSTALPGLAFLLIPFTDSFVQLAILVGICGVANGLSLGSLAASTYDVVPEHARGRLQAIRRTVAEIGGVGAPLLGGLLLTVFNPGAPFLAYAPVLLLGGVLLAFVAKETLVKERAPARA